MIGFQPREIMDLADIIVPSQVICDATASTKEQLLRELALRAASLVHLDPLAIEAALLAREDLGSTGLGEGFALPHARLEELDRMFSLFARLSQPVQFDAADGKPVDLIFLMLIPVTAGGEQLAALAAVCRRLRDQDFAARLREAPDVHALTGLLCGSEPREPSPR
jgi:PTS system nitrogen regulatory IIA component